MKAHHTAIVSKKAKIDADVEIGPYAIIEDDVEIARDVKIYARAYICSGTAIGEGTQVHMGVILGHDPQDFAYNGEKTYLRIGKRNIIREYATVHRGTKKGTSTEIGDDNFIMSHSHAGHNCKIGNKAILANGVLLGGHVEVEDGVFVSGNVVVHQFCRIGKLSMVGGFSGINKDVPPYLIIRGTSIVRGVNTIGLRRAGYKRDTIKEIKEVYGLLYQTDHNTTQALQEIAKRKYGKEIQHFINFVSSSKRGICRIREDRSFERDYGRSSVK